MKKKIMSLVLIAAMLFSTLPAFAWGGNSSGEDGALKPLTVSGGLDGIKYVSLGDSIAFGYGLNEEITNKAFNTVPGAYPDLMSKYLRCSSRNFFQGAVSATRAIDYCNFLSPGYFESDYYHDPYYVSKYFYTLGDEGYIEGVNDYDTFAVKLRKAVKDADFITVTTGGNDTISTLLVYLSTNNFASRENLTKMYGKAAVDSYFALKNSIIAQAKLIDAVSKSDVVSKANKVFDFIDMFLYAMGGLTKGQAELLDIIHEINPGAEIAISGLPGILADYDIDLGEGVTVDLAKVFKPMTKVLNSFVKNIAEERSSYVRYIDILDVDLLEVAGVSKVIDADQIEAFGENFVTLTHPSYEGHRQIAGKIIKSFDFRVFGEKTSNIKNRINNIVPVLKSKTGISKIENLLDSLKGLDVISLIKNAVKTIDLFPVLSEFFVNRNPATAD